MTAPKSLAAYAECEEHFEIALRAERGIAVGFDTSSEAVRFRHKMNIYREKLRKNSRKVYPVEDPRHGTSPYDHLQLSIPAEDNCRVYIRRYEIKVKEVVEL